MGVAILALRPDALRGRNLVPGLLAVAVGLGIVWLHYADLIPVMADTVYPGRRVSDGGGIELLQVVAHAFPYLLTNLFDPLPELWGTNACEVAVVGSFLPLALATFGDHRALAGWARAHWRALAIWGLGLAVMAAWMLAPVPGRYAPLLNMIPPNRMLWGFGLLSALGLIRLVAVAPFVLTWLRTTLFLGGVVAAWFVSKVVISDTPPELDRFDLLVAFPLIGLLVLRWRWPALLPPRRLVLLALAVTAAGTFGQFNPVQSARPIFERRPSAFLDALEDYAAAHPRGWVVVDGHFGAILNGAGLPAINHVLLQPQLDFFRAAYPDMAPDAFDQTFNRYAHVMLEPQAEPSVRQLDLVAIPPDPFGIPLPIRTLDAPPAGVAGGKVTALRTGERTWRVTLSGEGPWRGVRPDHALGLAMAPGVGRIVSASAYRLARPDLVESRKDRLAFAAGYGARIDVELAEMAAKFPTGAIAAVPLGD